MHVYFMDTNDVAVAKVDDRLSLDAESRQPKKLILESRVPAFRSDHLDRDESRTCEVSGLVHNSHATAAELTNNLITGDSGGAGKLVRELICEPGGNGRGYMPRGSACIC